MRKSWIGEALGKRAPSASYVPYNSGPAKRTNAAGPSTNPLPAGKRIGPKNKVKGYSAPKDTDAGENYTVDARIGSGPKVGFDPKAKRAPFAPSPTSKKGSSGRHGPSKYVGTR